MHANKSGINFNYAHDTFILRSNTPRRPYIHLVCTLNYSISCFPFVTIISLDVTGRPMQYGRLAQLNPIKAPCRQIEGPLTAPVTSVYIWYMFIYRTRALWKLHECQRVDQIVNE